MKVSVDVGYGYVKACNEHGETLHFPTIIKKKLSERIFTDNDIKYEAKINGSIYYIGELALEKKGSRSWGNDKSINADTDNYVGLCVHLLTKKEENNVNLMLGLPYNYYLNKEIREKISEEIKERVFYTTIDNESKSTSIEKVSVYPQGIGAYFNNLFDINGKPKNNAMSISKALMIDIGYRTVDVVAFSSRDNKLILVDSDSFSLDEKGVINVVTYVTNEIKDEYNAKMTDIEDILQNSDGILETRHATYDLKPFESEGYRVLASEIVEELNTRLHGNINDYKNIFITGGGAKKMFPFLKNNYDNIQLQEDYVFSNAKGYLAIESLEEA